MTEALSKIQRLQELLKEQEAEAAEKPVNKGFPEVEESEPQATDTEPPPPMTNLDYYFAYCDEPETLTAEERARVEKSFELRRRDRALMAPRKPGSTWGW